MNQFNYERWVESCEEALCSHASEYLHDDIKSPISDFLVFVEEKLHPEQFQELINSWLDTPAGKKWYQQMLDRMVENPPENDYDPKEDR